MRVISPKLVLYFLFIFSLVITSNQVCYCQLLQRQMLSSQGGTHSSSNGLIISQTIGQLSTNGTSIHNNFTIQQGFQQNFIKNFESKLIVSEISVQVFPNPFIETFTIAISSASEEAMVIRVFTLLGQLAYQGQLVPFQLQKTIPFLNYPTGSYIIQLQSKNKIISKKIIKN